MQLRSAARELRSGRTYPNLFPPLDFGRSAKPTKDRGGSIQPRERDHFDLKSVDEGDGLKQSMISDAIGSKPFDDCLDQSESLNNDDDCNFRTPDRVESTSYERVSHPSEDILDWKTPPEVLAEAERAELASGRNILIKVEPGEDPYYSESQPDLDDPVDIMSNYSSNNSCDEAEPNTSELLERSNELTTTDLLTATAPLEQSNPLMSPELQACLERGAEPSREWDMMETTETLRAEADEDPNLQRPAKRQRLISVSSEPLCLN